MYILLILLILIGSTVCWVLKLNFVDCVIFECMPIKFARNRKRLRSLISLSVKFTFILEVHVNSFYLNEHIINPSCFDLHYF